MSLIDEEYMSRPVGSHRPISTTQPHPHPSAHRRILFAAFVALLVSSVVYFMQTNKVVSAESAITTGHAATNLNPAPLVPPANANESHASQAMNQAFPANGTTQWYLRSNSEQLGTLRITDTSDLPGNKIARIRDAAGPPIAQVFIRNHESAEIRLPIGHYEVNIAFSETWYGPKLQFGATANYLSTNVDIAKGLTDYRLLPSGEKGKRMTPIQGEAF